MAKKTLPVATKPAAAPVPAPPSPTGLFSRKIPAFYTLLAFSLGILCSFAFTKNPGISGKILGKTAPSDASGSCAYNISRLNGFKFIHPLLYAEPECESGKYDDTKEVLANAITELQHDDPSLEVSIYLRDFQQGDWMSIADGKPFHPSSLIKVPALMSFLKDAERNPGMLDQVAVFNPATAKIRIPPQTFETKSIEPNKPYTIRELLRYMVAYSDNYATYLLNERMNIPGLQRLFTDLGLPAPDVTDWNFQISARDYSVFMKTLVNSSYLTKENSELALSILGECNFEQGLRAGLPAQTQLAHKFGEWGEKKTGLHEIHESGVFYLDGKPYLLTIMTHGKNLAGLPKTIAQLTKTVHEQLKNVKPTGMLPGDFFSSNN